MLPALLLGAVLAAVAWFVWGDLPGWPRWAARSRIESFRRWLAKSALAFLVPAVIGLSVLGRWDALWRVPPELKALAPGLPDAEFGIAPLLTGLAAGALLGLLVARRALRRGKRPFTIGDVESLIARTRAELPYGVAMSVLAGVAEELFYRLLLPLLGAIVTGSALVGAGGALLLFALMHRYQGWAGMLAAALVGALMQAIYLGTGALWPAMLIHALIDLNGLVVRPLLTGQVRRG